MESKPSVLGPRLMDAEWFFNIVTDCPLWPSPHGFNKSRFQHQAVVEEKSSMTQWLNASHSEKDIPGT